MMKPSIQLILALIAVLLFGAGLISLFLASREEQFLLLIGVAIANLLSVTSIVFLITRGILSPLDHIKSIIKKIKEGSYDTPLAIRGPQEIQELAKVLNEMIKQIHRERLDAQEAKAVLEIRVRARTRELQELAAGLEARVQERTRELEDKVRELERFQKLAVGRELKMLELKKTLNELQAKLQHKKKT